MVAARRIILDAPHGLSELLDREGRGLLRPAMRIELNFSTPSYEARMEYEVRVNRLLNECGCRAGAAALLLATLLYGACLLIDAPFLPATAIASTLGGLAFVVFAALAGKVWSLARAQRELRRIARQLKLDYASHGTTPCGRT
ncbi:MAG TPA: hypothetical protein VMN60_12230 [Longimicrobiales bacterium]|nr:hypothetical protein [Longimicrobiales bacterium]